ISRRLRRSRSRCPRRPSPLRQPRRRRLSPRRPRPPSQRLRRRWPRRDRARRATLAMAFSRTWSPTQTMGAS
ncbi:MAG: hypothetical protein FJZ90_14835, partial [Chloroflexi bacterium]|nr:hypothetical protein [Chloroflexota bacterium]